MLGNTENTVLGQKDNISNSKNYCPWCDPTPRCPHCGRPYHLDYWWPYYPPVKPYWVGTNTGSNPTVTWTY